MDLTDKCSSLQTSSRPRELGGSFSSRRGHGAQLSISDTNHHVTEAIGDMYGDDDYGNSYFEPANTNTRSRPVPSSNGYITTKSHTVPTVLPSQRNNHFDHAPL